MTARHDTVQLVKQVLYQAVFGSILRIRKVWQRRKCSVKNGILTISHATVSVSARSSPCVCDVFWPRGPESKCLTVSPECLMCRIQSEGLGYSFTKEACPSQSCLVLLFHQN